MKSRTTRSFREQYRQLAPPVRAQAKRAYRLFLANPGHPGLHFKQVDEVGQIYSARVGLGCRVLGKLVGGEIVWFWIGQHAKYDRLI